MNWQKQIIKEQKSSENHLQFAPFSLRIAQSSLSSLAGLGLFADQEIPKQSKIIKLDGERLSYAQLCYRFQFVDGSPTVSLATRKSNWISGSNSCRQSQ